MSTLYMIMGYGGLALAVLCLVAAVILFIRWDIPKVIGDMTGNTQKRAIAKIREERQKDMQLHDQADQTEVDSGKLHAQASEEPLTDVLQEEVKKTAYHIAATDEEVTDVLSSNSAVRLSGSSAYQDDEAVTSVLNSTPEEATTVLHKTDYSGESETTVLGQGNNREIITIPDEKIQESGTIIQILELIVTHTEDVVR